MESADCVSVAKKALEFTRKYYKTMDDLSSRPSIVQFYANFSNLCEWNGHKYSTQADLFNYLQELPKTHHTVDVVDAHPLPGNQPQSTNLETSDHSILITVHGSVTYDDEHKREFFQRFVVRQKGTTYYIVNDYYRWLAEKQ